MSEEEQVILSEDYRAIRASGKIRFWSEAGLEGIFPEKGENLSIFKFATTLWLPP